MVYSWITPVTNRAIADDWFLSINRVENNTAYIAEYLNDNGYDTSLETTTDWSVGGYFNRYADDDYRIRKNILTLVALVCPHSYRFPATLNLLTYQGANNIEKVLLELKTNAEYMVAALKHLEFTLGGQQLGA